MDVTAKSIPRQRLARARRKRRLAAIVRLASILLGAVIIALALLFAGWRDDQRIAYNQGLSDYMRGDRRSAESHLDDAIVLWERRSLTSSASINAMLERLLPGPEREVAARAYLLKGLLAIRPEADPLKSSLAESAGQQLKVSPAAALGYFKRCLEINPGNSWWYHDRSSAIADAEQLARVCQLNYELLSRQQPEPERKTEGEPSDRDKKRTKSSQSGFGESSDLP